MKPIRDTVFGITLLLFMYAICAANSWLVSACVAVFMLSPILLIWLLLKVLKQGSPAAFTFEGRFYEDRALTPLKDAPASVTRS